MLIDRNDDGTLDIWVRQSWLDTALRCGERARFGIIRPDLNVTSDSAAIGTATHAGIEAALLGKPVLTAMHDEWDSLFAAPMKRTLGMTDVEMIDESIALQQAWERDIAPLVSEPTGVEQSFNVCWYETIQNDKTYRVHLTGTIDCVTKNDIWDWKTAARKYNASEKQQHAIQPTVYAVAISKLRELEMPIDFNYGIMLRKQHTTQVVRCHRTERHEAWLARIVDPLIRQAITLGTHAPWTPNDTHGLCNSTWCPYWHLCKGQMLVPEDLQPTTNKEQ